MIVAITHLKAPWPAGARVGDVVDVGSGPLPECFIGKCVTAQEGATVQHTYARPVAPVDPLEALRAENAALRAMLEAKPSAADDAAPTKVKR